LSIPDYELKEPFYIEDIKWTSKHNWDLEDKSKRRDYIEIHDVTLRDGDQTPGSVFLEDERVRIADALAELKIPRIEAGMPVVSKVVENAMRRMVAKKYHHTKIFGFARALEKDVELCQDIGCDGVIVEYCVNPFTNKYAYQNTPKSIMDKLVSAISKAHEYGMYTVFMGWDWFRTPIEFTKPLMEELVQNVSLDGLAMVDTFGSATPDAVEEMFRLFKEGFPELRLEFHGHNDISCGVANCLAAVWGGAEVVHTAMNGLGDRCGNVPTEELAVLLEMHKGINTGLDLKQIAPTCELVSQISNVPFHDNKPVMGDRPYKVEAGILMDIAWKLNQNEDKKVTNFMISVDPKVVGREDEVNYVLGKNSGKKSVQLFLEKYNLEATDEQIDKILQLIIEEAMVRKGLVSESVFLKLVDKVINV
ncbi:MAG: LeuA family protein, partial [Brevefilum fermentans]